MSQSVRKIGNWIKEHSNLLKFIFLFSVLLFVINQMTQILQGMTWSELQQVLLSQKKTTLLIMMLVSLLAVLPMLIYDWVTVEILEENGKPRLSRKTLFTSAWTTNTINNLAGFGGVIGATLRAKFYGEHVPTKKVVTTVSKVAVFMLSGLSILCFFTFMDVFFIRPTNPYRSYWIWLLGGSLVTPVLFIFIQLKRKTLFSDFPLKRVLKLFLGSFGQWFGALVTFLTIGYLLELPVNVFQVYPLFVASTLIGMISMVPGGMGTFDVLMIVGLGHVGISRELAVAWLLYYRIFYYLFPFLTGLASFIHQTSTKINDFFDGLPKLIAQKVAHGILVGMVYFAGVMMVLLATVPNLSNISRLFQRLLPFSFNFLDQTLNMLIGFLLLGLARGVANRVKKAYVPTLAVLVFCIVNTISRTVSWKLIIFYVFLIACIYLARKEFYRKQLVFTWESLVFDGLLYGALFILYSIVGYYSTERIKHGQAPSSFLLFPSEDVWLAGLAGLILAAITVILLYQYLGTKERPGLYFDRLRIEWMLDKYSGTEYSHLIFLKDKRHYFYKENGRDKVMFTFELQGSNLFVLGNPVGDKTSFKQATKELYEYVDTLGYKLVFYGITDGYSLLLHDLGFNFMKIGEEGTLNLQDNSDKNVEISSEQIEVKRMAGQGFHFQILTPPISEEMMNEIEKVSDDWVKKQGERYFSVGRFKREYLNSAPVGIVYNTEREILAYISVKEIDGKKETSYDMLRYKQGVPSEINEFMLTHLLEECKNKGVEQFNIGLAPLSKVGESTSSFMKERMANTFYKYSYPIYSFKDIRQFKEEFATKWEPRYVSYQKGTNVIFLFIQLYLLIERGKRRRPRPVDTFMAQ